MGFTVQRLVRKVRDARVGGDRARRHASRRRPQQFDRAFETAPIGMAMTTVAGRFMRVNPALCTMLGRAREDLVGRKIEEITHPDDRADDRDAFPKLLSGEISTYQAEKRYLHVDGEIVWTLLSMTLVRDSAGAPRTCSPRYRTSPRRRLAEERLREAEERYRTMVEQLPLVTYVDALDDDSSAHLHESPGRAVARLLGRGVAVRQQAVPEAAASRRSRAVMEEVVRCNKTGDAVQARSTG